MRPDIRNQVENRVRCQQSVAAPCPKEFKEGDTVWARNYREGNKWIPGTIQKRQGPQTYKVKISETLIWKCHVDQLRARVEEADYFTLTCKPTVTQNDQDQLDDAQHPSVPPDQEEEETNIEHNETPPCRYPKRERHPPVRY